MLPGEFTHKANNMETIDFQTTSWNLIYKTTEPSMVTLDCDPSIQEEVVTAEIKASLPTYNVQQAWAP